MPQERERVYAGRHRIQEKPAKSQPIRTEMELDGGEASDVQFRMFTGTFGQHVIRATHPLIVVADETVLGSFSTLEAAEEFIARQDSSSTVILRHHGQKWVPAEDRPAVLIPQNFTSGAVRENGFHALRPPEATLISRIQEALQKFPHITYLAGTHFLEVPAQTRNGFRVWIRERAGRDTVGFEKWHEEFTNAASAFNFFMLGLSRLCRLRVMSCGGMDYKWQVQRRVDQRWVTVNESGMVFFPFWLQRTERYLQNDIITPP